MLKGRISCILFLILPFWFLGKEKYRDKSWTRSQQGLPYATIQIQGENIGVSSDEYGYFRLETNAEKPVLVIQFMGFETEK